MGILTWILVTLLADGSIVQSFQRAAQKVTVIAGWQKPQNKRVDVESPPEGKNGMLGSAGRIAFFG